MDYGTNQIGVHSKFARCFINGLLYIGLGTSDTGNETCDVPINSELVSLAELREIAGIV